MSVTSTPVFRWSFLALLAILAPDRALCQAGGDPSLQEGRAQIRAALRELVLEKVSSLNRSLTDKEQAHVQAHLMWMDEVSAAIPEDIARNPEGRAWVIESARRPGSEAVYARPWKRPGERSRPTGERRG